MSGPGCPVLSVLSRVTYLADLSSPTYLYCPILDVRSQMSCSRCPVPDVLYRCPVLTRLSCPGCPVFQLFCPGNLANCSSDAAVMSWQSCPLFPFQAPVQADLLGQPVFCCCLAVVSWLSCPSCPVPAVIFHTSWSIPAVLSWLFCSTVLLLLYLFIFVHSSPDAAVISWKSILSVLSRLTSPG